jgi:L-alanine-DL-glutamate epimerase-like enolase superfamily enzyme
MSENDTGILEMCHATSVRVVDVTPIPVSYTEPNDDGSTRHLCLVRIDTDDGHVGWGEAVTMWPEASRATSELVSGLAELVIDTDPVRVEETWRRLQEHTWWYGGGGIASFAIAAIDIALWDLRGKALDRPVLDLLGGPARRRLPVVASGHATVADLDDLIETTATWVRGRAQGVKVGFGKRGSARLGFDRERDVAFVKGLRDALGPEPMIMVDLGVRNRWSAATAIDRVRAFETYGLEWIEEPLGPDDPRGYAELHAKTHTKIAYGEREWSVRGLRRVIESGTCDVVGIDPGRAEGITGFVQACRICEHHRVQANAHSWSSAIVAAASLAVSWAMPPCELLEHKPLRNPMQHDLAEHAPTPADGWWPMPTRPGLGIEVDPQVVDSLRLDRG